MVIRRKNDAYRVNTTGMDYERMLFCALRSAPPNGCRYTTPYQENKNKGRFSVANGGWEAEACTPPGVLLTCL